MQCRPSTWRRLRYPSFAYSSGKWWHDTAYWYTHTHKGTQRIEVLTSGFWATFNRFSRRSPSQVSPNFPIKVRTLPRNTSTILVGRGVSTVISIHEAFQGQTIIFAIYPTCGRCVRAVVSHETTPPTLGHARAGVAPCTLTLLGLRSEQTRRTALKECES